MPKQRHSACVNSSVRARSVLHSFVWHFYISYCLCISAFWHFFLCKEHLKSLKSACWASFFFLFVFNSLSCKSIIRTLIISSEPFNVTSQFVGHRDTERSICQSKRLILDLLLVYYEKVQRCCHVKYNNLGWKGWPPRGRKCKISAGVWIFKREWGL